MSQGETLYELALFAGAGGGILGGILRGHVTVGAVEIEAYPRDVLLQRQRDGILPRFPVWDDVTTFRQDNPECREYIDMLRSVRDQLVISGGFPCQDISSAGKGAGLANGAKSSLWFEFSRIIGEIQPRRVLVENSPLLVSRGLDIVLSDLAQMGYNAPWGIISAADTGAPHERKRSWILADAMCHRSQGIWKNREIKGPFGLCSRERCNQEQDLRHADSARISTKSGVHEGNKGSQSMGGGKVTQWEIEPDMGRVAHGVASRVDRLKAIGNGQVPGVVELVWEILG
jgi:DNA (cytosine-5)-methyltransferase 1